MDEMLLDAETVGMREEEMVRRLEELVGRCGKKSPWIAALGKEEGWGKLWDKLLKHSWSDPIKANNESPWVWGEAMLAV